MYSLSDTHVNLDKDVAIEVFLVSSCLLFGSKCVKFQNCTWKNRNIVCAESDREWNANSRRLRPLAMFDSLRSLFATTISTEPVILFLNLGVGIVYGSGLPTYLQGVNSIDILNF